MTNRSSIFSLTDKGGVAIRVGWLGYEDQGEGGPRPLLFPLASAKVHAVRNQPELAGLVKRETAFFLQ
jgi:hypothetical protein